MVVDKKENWYLSSFSHEYDSLWTRIRGRLCRRAAFSRSVMTWRTSAELRAQFSSPCTVALQECGM